MFSFLLFFSLEALLIFPPPSDTTIRAKKLFRPILSEVTTKTVETVSQSGERASSLITTTTPADVIYSFDSYCAVSDVGTLTDTTYNCVFGNGALFENGNIILQSSAYASMDSAITQLFNSNSKFSIELYKVTTGSYQSPVGAEFFVLLTGDESNFINLFNNKDGYLSLGAGVGEYSYSQVSTSSFHSIATRNYAVTVDLDSRLITLYLAGNEIAHITLPSSNHQFSSPITVGRLNGFYDSSRYRLTYAAYDEVRLYGAALSAAEVLANHQSYMTRTNRPTAGPTAAPSSSPSLLPTPQLSFSFLSDPPSLVPSKIPSGMRGQRDGVDTSSPTPFPSSGVPSLVLSIDCS
jgi:hypothetical protein